ncbi:MAG: hypothetical protein A2675_02475 [Candidatus Yonathbacteria bacterium RIFCSPHIGHO2_01_FULL_51_10]|uniref:Uncharacterized protein n=1 Tax=Candidatus Yonathbacteria bacterium RIFCSPHIGHO2_01_FULL_51_10 TaxID=1802723 RepID=A0A1G2S5H8_9BACT|nr:MAG: hypothetical protein A2675_02475 [Candidatus Yonathbacteria bacterium RIFCSPHIGHO2_01_FULL_51_10]
MPDSSYLDVDVSLTQFVARLCPNLSAPEQAEAVENLRQYLKVIERIHARLTIEEEVRQALRSTAKVRVL